MSASPYSMLSLLTLAVMSGDEQVRNLQSEMAQMEQDSHSKVRKLEQNLRSVGCDSG